MLLCMGHIKVVVVKDMSVHRNYINKGTFIKVHVYLKEAVRVHERVEEQVFTRFIKNYEYCMENEELQVEEFRFEVNYDAGEFQVMTNLKEMIEDISERGNHA